MDWKDLEKKEICLFGAGLVGKTSGYDTIRAFGLKVDFYCDNNIAPGTIIRDDIEVRDIQYLYQNKENVWVLITVSKCYQEQIVEQLEEHGLHNYEIIGWSFICRALDAIDASDDEMVKQRSHMIYDDLEYLEKFYEYRMDYKLNIINPTTFSEKLQWLKLYDRRPEYIRMVDKYEVKRFVEKRLGSGYIVPTLGVWDSFEEIDFDKLPEQFVLKCTHDSGSIVVVKDKEIFDKEEARRKLSTALQINFFWICREWPYKNVKRRIIAEKYIEEIDGNLFDYKVHCFNGEPTYIQVMGNRDLRKHLGFQLIYDFEWNELKWTLGGDPKFKEELKKPSNLQELYQLSKILCKGLKYIRIDFYIVSGRILLGEMTFYPRGGFCIYDDDWKRETDLVLGKKIIL